MLIVTCFAAAILALLLIVLAILTILARIRFGTLLSDGGEINLTKFIRAHGNLAEYLPIFLILLGLIEINHFLSSFWLWLMALVFIVARISHAVSLLFIEPKTLRLRQFGVIMTFVPIVLLALNLIFKLIANLFS